MNHEKPIIKNKEWIGRIPSDWDFVKIKEHFVERNTKVDDISFPPLSVSMGGVVDQIENVSKSDNSENRKLVKKNDFVINSRSDRKGSSGISPRDGSVSLINIVLKPKNINPKYSEYLFKSYYFKEEFFRNGKGIHFDLWSTRYELMKQIFIPYPKIEEQNKIVEYLDNETHQIEKLTKKIEKKIELLKEQRISLINEVVTKGLNPNVEMKDSGIEWIGEIPSHWKTLRSKYIFSEKPSNGIFKKKDQFGFGTKIINVSDVYTNNFLISDENLDSVDCTKEEESSFGVKNGDQFFIRSSLKLEGIGVSSMYIGEEPCVFECHVVKISPNQDIIVPRFLNYYLNSSVCREYFIKHSNTVTMTTIPQEPIKNIQVPIPSKKEQEEIIEYLNKKTMLIDLNISKEKKRIELLKEYKQSLISELVTGKKRVV